jgi:hypothetical protein
MFSRIGIVGRGSLTDIRRREVNTVKSKILFLTVLCAALVAFPGLSNAAERATEEDAVRMV